MTSATASISSIGAIPHQLIEENITVRLISPVGEEFHYNVAATSTILDLKRQIQKSKPHIKSEKLFFFYELRNVDDSTRIHDIDYIFSSTYQAILAAENLIPSDPVKPISISHTNKPQSIALIYGYDNLGRWSNKNSRNQFCDEIMVQHLLRLSPRGLEAHLILDKLFLGNINAAFNCDELRNNGVTHVVTAHNVLNPLYTKYFTYMTINAEDLYYQNIIDHFNSAIIFIDEAIQQGGSVLVHCAAGISRSASIVIAYLMYKMNITFADAFKHVKERRAIISPNDGFTQQLKLFEELNYDIANATEEQRKIIDGYKKCSVSITPRLTLDQGTPKKL